MIVIGLTGGIACGKSTVADIIREHGIPVVDADIVAREIVAADTPALKAIVERFGAHVLQADGSLDRAALAKLVMGDSPQQRHNRGDLEAITHPEIGKRISEMVTHLGESGHDVVVIEAALMIESGTYKKYDVVVVVGCESRIQCQRLMEREGFDEQTAQRWIASQLPLSDKIAVADAVIENNGSRSDLKRVVLSTLDHLMTGLDKNT